MVKINNIEKKLSEWVGYRKKRERKREHTRYYVFYEAEAEYIFAEYSVFFSEIGLSLRVEDRYPWA